MRTQLSNLTQSIHACRICRDAPHGERLAHEPRPVFVVSERARILIAGQAPGTRVHESGRPFTDMSGDRLRSWLGVSPEEFYDPLKFAILPMGFCFPGQDSRGADLPPRRECAPTWRSSLVDGMPQIELVLAVGLYAQAWHLGTARSASLTETVRNWRQVFSAETLPGVVPLPHPSWRNTGWLRRNPWFETELLPFLKAEIRRRINDE